MKKIFSLLATFTVLIFILNIQANAAETINISGEKKAGQTSPNVISKTIVWKKLASLPETCSGGGAVALNNKIYYVAGSHAPSTQS